MTQENDLQNDVVTESNEVEEAQHENHDQQHGGDSEAHSEPQHEENGEDVEAKPINQESVNDAIAKQHAKYREEQRLRLAAEEQVRHLQNNSANTDPEPQIVEVDTYAEDFDDQLKQRDESIKKHIAWQNRQAQRQQQFNGQREQQQIAENQQAAERAKAFMQRATDAKVDQSALSNAVQSVGQYQLGQEVAQYLMADDMGVQMTMQLAQNPALLADLSLMPPYQRILHIERNVRAKQIVKPRQSASNKPPTRVKGRAADASDSYPLTGGKVMVE